MEDATRLSHCARCHGDPGEPVFCASCKEGMRARDAARARDPMTEAHLFYDGPIPEPVRAAFLRQSLRTEIEAAHD